ncbi:MAG: DUF362 domain-containing protein [Anaerolineales bacterium]|nr:DUF362 domain-containing protein [Anaerolineales bacterium]
MSRRTFLRLAALAGIGAGAAIIRHNTAWLGTGNFLRWVLRAQLQRISPPAIVALGGCESYSENILGCLRDLWTQAEMPDLKGKRVLVKPNLVDAIESNPVTTAPQVVGAVIDLLEELGAGDVSVGDGSAFRRDTGAVAQDCGLMAVLEMRDVPFVDLNYDDPAPVPVRDGWLQRSEVLWLPRHVREADYIVSVPKLKTHHWAGVSLSMKNLLGVVPGSRYGWPKNFIHMSSLNAAILGVYVLMPPVLAVVDGIIGMEGDGPLFGGAVAHGVLVAGKEALGVDVACAQLMGFQIQNIPHLDAAVWAGVGQGMRIERQGEDWDAFQRQYQPPPSL